MKILLSIHHYMDRNAGAPGVTYRLAEEYKKLGHQVEIFSYDQLPSNVSNNIANLIFPKYLLSRIHKLQKSGNVDVVDASSGDVWLYSLLRNKRKGPLVITRSHGLEHVAHEIRVQMKRKGDMKLSWKYPLYHGGYRLWEIARSFQLADGAVFLNRDDREYAIRKFGLRASAVIGNGIPDYLLGLPAPKKLEEGEKTIRIAIIGSYISRKGIQFAAEALTKVMMQHDGVEVTFLGTQCPPEAVWKDYTHSLHHRIKVIPRFVHEELPALLQKHHIKLFPTLSEGFGLALVEAMACGLAPIVTDIPGPREIVSNRNDAIVIPAGNSDAIAEAIDLMLRDRILMHRLRMNAYGTAQQYSWRMMAEKNLEFYQQCLDQTEKTKQKLIG